MHTKILFTFALVVSVTILWSLVFFGVDTASFEKINQKNTIANQWAESLCQNITLSGADIYYLQCGNSLSFWSISQIEAPKNLTSKNWEFEKPTHGVVSLSMGNIFSSPEIDVVSDEDAVFITTRTTDGFPRITALTAPITITLKDTNNVSLTRVVLLPGMSLTHNPQLSDLRWVDFFRVTQLLSVEMADITQSGWIRNAAPWYDLESLISRTRQSQQSMMGTYLDQIQEQADILKQIVLEENIDPIESSLMVNKRKTETIEKKWIGERLSTLVESYKKSSTQDSTKFILNLENEVQKLTPIDENRAKNITTLIDKLKQSVKISIDNRRVPKTFSDYLGVVARDNLNSKEGMSSKNRSNFFTQLRESSRAKTIDQAITQTFVAEQLAKYATNGGNLTSSENIELWARLTKDLVDLISSIDERKATLSYLLDKGNTLIGSYHKILKNEYFLPDEIPYIILDRQQRNPVVLPPSQVQSIDNVIKNLNAFLKNEESNFYTISDTYNNDALDPFKLLKWNLKDIERTLGIINHLWEYRDKKYEVNWSNEDTKSSSGTVQAITTLTQAFESLKISTGSIEKMDELGNSERAMDSVYNENTTLSIKSASWSIEAANISLKQPNITFQIRNSGKLDEFVAFMTVDLKKIQEKIVGIMQENSENVKIPLDISQHSFTLDGKTYSY